MNLSPNFTLAEMTVSQEGARSGLRNEPDMLQIDALVGLCQSVLEPLRARVKRPVVVNSGYRSTSINRRVGGSNRSQHCRGEAADILIPGMSVQEVVGLIRTMNLPFDQVINEFDQWTHVSHARNGKQRGNVLMAYRTGGNVEYRKLA